MGTIGTKHLFYIMLFSVLSYLMGRIFYVPPKYCYIQKVGYRSEKECNAIESLKKKMPEIRQATVESMVQINLWYYEAWKEKLNEQGLGCREYYLSSCGYLHGNIHSGFF